MSDQNTKRPHGGAKGRKARFAVLAGVLLGAGALLGGLGTMAMNASAFGDHGNGYRHGRGGEHGGDPQRMLERTQKKVARLLAAVDATPEQTSQVESIVQETVERMAGLREDKRSVRTAFMDELLQSPINRDSLEQLRQRQLAGMDQLSAVMLDGAVRAAEVLTPEQRETVREKIRSRHGLRH